MTGFCRGHYATRQAMAQCHCFAAIAFSHIKHTQSLSLHFHVLWWLLKDREGPATFLHTWTHTQQHTMVKKITRMEKKGKSTHLDFNPTLF